MSDRGRGYRRYRGDSRSSSSSSSRYGNSQPKFYTDARRVTAEEAEALREQFNPTKPAIPYTGPKGPSLRADGFRGQDGKIHMLPYESKDGNNERNVPLPLAPAKYDVGKAIRDQLRKDRMMMEHIRASFYAKTLDDCVGQPEPPLPFNRQFLVIHFGIYCTSYEGTHPGEFAIASFSVRDGLRQCYGRMLDPATIPFGYRSDFYGAVKEKGYELPGFDPNMDLGTHCLDVIESFLEDCVSEDDPHGTLYTARPDVDIVKEALTFIAKKTGRAFNFKVFPMSRLLELLLVEGEQLRSLNRIVPSSMVYAEENAIGLMVDGKWNDYKELACKFHQHSSKIEFMDHCSMSLVKRWIYNSMGLLTKMYCCPMYLYTHIPKLDPPPKLIYHIPKEQTLGSTGQDSSKLGLPVDNSTAPGLGRGRLPGQRLSSTTSSLQPESITSEKTELSVPKSKFSGASGNQSQTLDSSQTSDVESIAGTSTAGVKNSTEKQEAAVSAAASTTESGSAPAPQAEPIVEEEEIDKLLSTFEVYPTLKGVVLTPPNAKNRSMEVFKLPDMGPRQFPSEGIDLVEFVAGGKRTSPRTPLEPATMLTFQNDAELKPLASDFSFKSFKTNERPRTRLGSTDSVVSGWSDCGTIDSNITSISRDHGPDYDPLAKAGAKQAAQVLKQGVLPQTRFVYTDKVFWEDVSGSSAQSSGSGAELARRSAGRGRGRGRSVGLMADDFGGQPKGLEMSKEAIAAWQQNVSAATAPNVITSHSMYSDEEESILSSLSSMDLKYYKERRPPGFTSDLNRD